MKEHLVQRQEDLQHDQNDDVPFHSQAAAVLQEFQNRLGGTREEFQFAFQGGVALADFKFVFQAQEKAFQIGTFPGQIGLIVHLHAADHFLLAQERSADVA